MKYLKVFDSVNFESFEDVVEEAFLSIDDDWEGFKISKKNNYCTIMVRIPKNNLPDFSRLMSDLSQSFIRVKSKFEEVNCNYKIYDTLIKVDIYTSVPKIEFSKVGDGIIIEEDSIDGLGRFFNLGGCNSRCIMGEDGTDFEIDVEGREDDVVNFMKSVASYLGNSMIEDKHYVMPDESYPYGWKIIFTLNVRANIK